MTTSLPLGPRAYIEKIDRLIMRFGAPVVLEDPTLFMRAIENSGGFHETETTATTYSGPARLETGEAIALPQLRPIGMFRGVWLFDAAMVRASTMPPGYVLAPRGSAPERFDLSGPGGEPIGLADVDTVADARAAAWAHHNGKRSAVKMVDGARPARELTPEEHLALVAARLRKRGVWIDSNPAPASHTAARWAAVRELFSGELSAEQWGELESLWAATAGLVTEGGV